MHYKLKDTPGLYITGFMASGKTTVGRMLADRIGWNFRDLDEEIEAREQSTVVEIFEKRGEPEFRRLETEMIQTWIQNIERGTPTILALGGGTFVQPRNFELLENNGISLWLDCPFDIVQERIDRGERRPLARDPEALKTLYDERQAAYKRADFRIDVSHSSARAVDLILQLPFWK
jgi:shikimate kinase